MKSKIQLVSVLVFGLHSFLYSQTTQKAYVNFHFKDNLLNIINVNQGTDNSFLKISFARGNSRIIKLNGDIFEQTKQGKLSKVGKIDNAKGNFDTDWQGIDDILELRFFFKSSTGNFEINIPAIMEAEWNENNIVPGSDLPVTLRLLSIPNQIPKIEYGIGVEFGGKYRIDLPILGLKEGFIPFIPQMNKGLFSEKEFFEILPSNVTLSDRVDGIDQEIPIKDIIVALVTSGVGGLGTSFVDIFDFTGNLDIDLDFATNFSGNNIILKDINNNVIELISEKVVHVPIPSNNNLAQKFDFSILDYKESLNLELAAIIKLGFTLKLPGFSQEFPVTTFPLNIPITSNDIQFKTDKISYIVSNNSSTPGESDLKILEPANKILDFGSFNYPEKQIGLKQILIENDGNEQLDYVFSSNSNRIIFRPKAGTLLPGHHKNISVEYEALGLFPPANREGIINIISNGGDHEFEFNVDIIGNSRPILKSGDVDPPDGISSDKMGYTYSVVYRDKNNDSPTLSNLVINGNTVKMSKIAENNNSISSGVEYIAKVKYSEGILNLDNNVFYFEFSDGQYDERLPANGTFKGPFIESGEPNIRIVEPDGNRDFISKQDLNTYKIIWETSDPDGDSLKIDLFYSTSRNTDLIVPIASDINDTGRYTWDLNNVSAGTYFIYGVVDDGKNQSDDNWSAGLVTISEFNYLPPSTGFDNPIETLGKYVSDRDIAIDSNDRIYIVYAADGINLIYKNINDSTWSEPYKIKDASSGEFNPRIITDNNNIHITWTHNEVAGNNEIYYIKLDNNLQTLINEVNISKTSRHSDIPKIALSDDGTIHISWIENVIAHQDENSITSYDRLFYLKSSDGGNNWSAPQNLNSELPKSRISTSSHYRHDIETYNNSVLVSYEEDESGIRDIFFRYSPDNGNSWNNLINVTKGAYNTTYTSIVQTSDEKVHLLFRGPSSNAFTYATSQDNGQSWSFNEPITYLTNVSFPDIIAFGDSLVLVANYFPTIGPGQIGVFFERFQESFSDTLGIGVTLPQVDRDSEGNFHIVGGNLEFDKLVYITNKETHLPLEINILDVETRNNTLDNKVFVSWETNKILQADTKVSLYYDIDTDLTFKTLIRSDLPETGSHEFSLSNIPKGEYYLYFEIEEEDGLHTGKYYTNKFSVSNHIPTISTIELSKFPHTDTLGLHNTLYWNASDIDYTDILSLNLFYTYDWNDDNKHLIENNLTNTGSFTFDGRKFVPDTVIFLYLEVDDGFSTVGTYHPAGLITSVENENTSKIPANFKLNQNYPNPFNPTTNISFDIQTTSSVTLEIFNILGQEVRLLLNQQLPPGNYSFTWDGKNDLGMQVASGVYIYRLTAGKKVKTRKMLLIK